MTPDPALDAIRNARKKISNDVDNNVARLIQHYKQMQTVFSGRVITGPEGTPEEPQGAPTPSEAADGRHSSR